MVAFHLQSTEISCKVIKLPVDDVLGQGIGNPVLSPRYKSRFAISLYICKEKYAGT